MSSSGGKCPFNFTRRGFLGLAGGLAAAAGVVGYGVSHIVPTVSKNDTGNVAINNKKAEPFWGKHQSGIVTPPQENTYFAAFDLVTEKREEVIQLLKIWTDAAARMAEGLLLDETQSPPNENADSGEATGLPPARLTITFGFGPGLFVRDGKDRYGLAKHRPEAFVDLPVFNGDQLVPEKTGGDLSVQACADDPQVAFHAVRQLARLADYKAQIRWTQTGFITTPPDGDTPRNLMGFKDGTGNSRITDNAAMDRVVWIGNEGPDWMQGGSYVVARRIRIALEHWDRTKIGFQEQTVGRYKGSGAPLGQQKEFEPMKLDAVDKDGNFIIPENSHVRLATPASNGGAEIFRRPYSYNDGINFTAERWPPWRQGMEYDAGLFFICYQKDPRTGFIKIFDKMSKLDMMNQFVTHVGGGMFACPAGAVQGEYIGQKLFMAA